jgi:FOG: Ankyrin repeat
MLCDGRVDPNRQDKFGRTPLSYAAGHGHTEVVKALLYDSRVDPARQHKYDRTPLSYAAQYGHTEVVKALLCNGQVDPNLVDHDG